MKRWPMRPLGELVMPTEQRDPREMPGAEFAYVDIASVDNRAKVILPAKRIVGRDAPSRARKVVRAGDILVAMVRPSLNAVALVPASLDDQICSTGFAVLRPGPQLAGGYLFAFVRSPEFISHLIARAVGANYPAVTDGDVRSARVPLPPLAEQERIVRLLDEAEGLRRLCAQADRRLDALFQSMLCRAFNGEL
jgi:type I restriction enzyme S subunit